MIQQDSAHTVSGQITVDATADDGSGTLRLSNAATSASYKLEFCPYPSPRPSPQQDQCTPVTEFNSDSAGKAKVDFHFPKDGVWAGIFVVVRDGTAEFVSGFNLPGTGTQYLSALKQASSITSGTGGINPGGDGLKSGSVTVNDSTAHVELQNAITDVTYTVTFCLNGGGSSCYQIGTLSTDSTGSGSTDIDLLQALGALPGLSGIFRLNRSEPLPNGGDAGGVQFMTAFVSGCQQVRCQ